MIQALLHGKLSREQENMEDILTSTVFGILRYLPAEDGLLPFLSKSQISEGKSLTLPGVEEGAHAEYQFWPFLKERGSHNGNEFECHPCEPDVLIKLCTATGDRFYILIEAKFYSGKSSGPDDNVSAPYDQLAREWDNLVCLSERENAEPLLIYLTSDFVIPADQIEESRREYLQKRRSGRFLCGWLTWREIPRVFRDEPDMELGDLIELCKRLNLQFFDHAIHVDAVPPVGWRFQAAELRFEWRSKPLFTSEWRYEG